MNGELVILLYVVVSVAGTILNAWLGWPAAEKFGSEKFVNSLMQA